ncbi:uncharacterized protein LOC119538494 isoform X1 [Choloepus didactylus]|uniref:uncharacterized protein LOC119538494 isoform X1 n=1 Tax=Choloepus didactylus TaxID=27675 RepID=UPI0018A11DCE|nr:uncharacterized protein LOC119538494 isoform X1 [Choloepus didactylus]
MGQSPSSSTCSPLQCFLKNFQDFRRRAAGSGAIVNPGTLWILCKLEWPTFPDSNWPPEGTLNLPIAFQVQRAIYGKPEHPDQIPYIETWIDVLTDHPKWLKDCSPPKPSRARNVLVLKGQPRRPLVLNSPQATLFCRALCPQPRALCPQPGALCPQPRVLCSQFKAPYSKFRGTPCSHSRFSYALETLSSPPHTHSGVSYGPHGQVLPHTQLPLRQVIQGPREDPKAFIVYVPFSTSDLYNWKNQNPSFSQNPQGLICLLESVFFTHQPTWEDCQQLLQTLYMSEERERIRAQGQKLVVEPDGLPTMEVDHLEAVLPITQLRWDPNTDQVPTGLTL